MSPILHYLSLKLNFKFNSRSLFYLVALLTTCPQHIQTCLPETLTGLITALRELSPTSSLWDPSILHFSSSRSFSVRSLSVMVDTFNQMNRFLIQRLVSQLDSIFKKNYTNICIKWKEAMGQRYIWNQLWYTHNSKLHSIFFITRCHLTLMWLKYTPESRRPSNWMVVGRTDREIRTTLRA